MLEYRANGRQEVEPESSLVSIRLMNTIGCRRVSTIGSKHANCGAYGG